VIPDTISYDPRVVRVAILFETKKNGAGEMDVKAKRTGVRDVYSKTARSPKGSHPFPVGRRFAKSVGYPPALLNAIPQLSVESFSGVSNVSVFAPIEGGATVLDLGCGAGLDAIIASRRVGFEGLVVGVDFSSDMIFKARRAVAVTKAENLELMVASGERLPLETDSIDLTLVNGIFNLNPLRAQLFRELARVMRTGGTVWSAEIILNEPLPEALRTSEAAWFA